MAKDEKLEFEVPNPPEHTGALAELPATVKKAWRAAYSATYIKAAADTENSSERHGIALREANRLIKVEEPEDHEDAYEIPDWQVMKREEVEYKDMPKHAQDEVKAADGRKSGQYVRVYTTDGKEYFFPVPEKKAKPAEPKGTDDKSKGAANDKGGATA
jgi:hypothetical protein